MEFWEENVKFTKGEPHNWEVDLPDVIKTPFYVFSISKNGDLVFSAVIKDNKLKRLSSDITLKKVK